MSARLKSIRIQNYRSLADVSLDLRPDQCPLRPERRGEVDACWTRSGSSAIVPSGASNSPPPIASHGIGLLFDGADEGSSIRTGACDGPDRVRADSEVSRQDGSSRTRARGCYSLDRGEVLFERRPGTAKADFFHLGMGQSAPFDLREPEKLSFARYLDFEPDCDEAIELDRILHFVHFYHSRSLNLWGLEEARFERRIRDRI